MNASRILLAAMTAAFLAPTLAEWEKPTGKNFKSKGLAGEVLKAVDVDASNSTAGGVSLLESSALIRKMRSHHKRDTGKHENKNKNKNKKMRHVKKGEILAHKSAVKKERKRLIEERKRQNIRRAHVMAIKAKKAETAKANELKDMEAKNLTKLEMGFETEGECYTAIKNDFAFDVKHALFKYINKAKTSEKFEARLKETDSDTEFSQSAECGPSAKGVYVTIKMKFTNQDVADFLELKNLPHELSQMKKESVTSEDGNSEIFNLANGWLEMDSPPVVSFLKLVTSKGKVYHLADIDALGESDLENLFHIPEDERVD